MKVSVVIPTYNRAHLIVDAVASVLAQHHTDLELVVVDDGSTDDTAVLVGAIRDRRLTYVRARHAGVSAARNLGVRQTAGDLVAFLDSDDLWQRDKLACEVALLARHPEVDVVFSDLEKRHGDRVYGSFMRQTAVFSRRLRDVWSLAVLFISPDSLHIMDQARGEEAMIRLLAREQERLAGDRAALAAVRRGLVTRIKHCGWYHIDHGRRIRACGVYLRGFSLTGNAGLLIRALAAWIPGAVPAAPTEDDRRHPALARF